jgi:type VI secretion system secreted protein VgrG
MTARNAQFSLFVPLVAALVACGGSSPAGSLTTSPDQALTRSAAVSAASLGAASGFAVLGGAGVTCTSSIVTGNVGSLLTVTRTPTCNISGNIHQGDATANLAFTNFASAYDAFKGMTCPPANNLTGKNLGGMTLSPGVYCFDTTASLTGKLVLNGSSNDIWVFQIGTAITTGVGSVVMAGRGQACNVYWQLGTAGTIGTQSAFQGNILAGSAVTFTGVNSSLVGRALAKTAVTMTGTHISACPAGGGGGGGGGPPDCTGKDKDNKKCKCKDKDRDRDGDHDRDNKSHGHGDKDCDDDDDHHDRDDDD